MRNFFLASVVSLALVGCPSARHGEPAKLEVTDGGGAVLAYAGKIAPVPPGDLGHAGTHVTVSVDEDGKRLAYPLPGGGARMAYVVGDALFLGPTGPAVRGGGRTDFGPAPSLDDALGAIFDEAAGRRAEAVAAVKKERGDAAVARMLGAASHVEDRAWEDAFAKLPAPEQAEVQKALARALEPGAPTAGLARAVRSPGLDDPARASKIAARIRELVHPIREPRATAVLVRALAKNAPDRAGEVGCEVLAEDPLAAKHQAERTGREILYEAALVAIAKAGATCDLAEQALLVDPCVPYVRCADGKPLTGREPTRQDEPLCTKAELAPVIDGELARKPEDVMASLGGTRPELFAYAALLAKDRLPAAFVAAHARRRYALTEPKQPVCDTGVAPGTPCRCEEAIVRDASCRFREAPVVSVGLCKFDVDDRQKKIGNVVATLPP